MKTDISFISPFWYTWRTINQWFWMFRRYNLIDGFIMRICGVYINHREKNGTEKLIAIHKKRFAK